MNPIHDKVLKLFNLWQGAVGGEKEQTRKVMVNLLKQHGLTLRDIDPTLPPVRDPNDLQDWRESNLRVYSDQPIVSPEVSSKQTSPSSKAVSSASSDSAPLWRRFLAPALAFALVALLGAALLRPKDASGGVGDPLLGKSAPTFVLKTLDGGTLSSAQLRGKPLVLNFWASWCVPCRDEAPLLREVSEKQSAEGINVVGVLFNDPNEKRMRSFIAEYGLAYPNLLDNNLNTSINYGITGVPETFFIGADGVIKAVERGGLTRERLAGGLKTIGVNF